MLVQDLSLNQIEVDARQKPSSAASIKVEESFAFNQLQLLIDRNATEDIKQLSFVLDQILNYPSSDKAEFHRDAMRLGNFDLQKNAQIQTRLDTSMTMLADLNQKQICPCCGFTKQQDQIKLCTSFDDVKNMGVSTYLYFSTYKNLSLLLLVMLIVYVLYSIATNVLAASTLSSAGVIQYNVDYLTISLSSKQINDTATNRMYYYVQCWLGVVTVLIWSLVLVCIKFAQIKNAKSYDDDTISCSDYSVVLEGVPVDVTKEELQKQMNAYYEAVMTNNKSIPAKWKKPFKIEKLNVGKPFYLNQDTLKDEEFLSVEKEITEIKQELVGWIKERQTSNKFGVDKKIREQKYAKYAELNKRRGEQYAQIAKKIKQALKQQSNDELTTAFVTFDTNLAKSLMDYLNQNSLLSKIRSLFGRDQNKFMFEREGKFYDLNVRRAPQPEDIKWVNIGQRDCTSITRKIFTFTVTLALLGVCFAIVFGLTKAQQDAGQNRYISIAISITISIVNVLLGQLIRFLTLYQRDYTQTNHQASLAIKSILAQMINCILIPVITAFYIKKKIYETSGLVDNIFILSITTSLIPPILLMFDPYNLYMKIQRCLKSRPSSKLQQTQKQYNALYEGVPFQIGYQYLYVVNLFMFVCFFVSLQPIVVPIAMVGYLLMYWVQKYCLFNRYKRPVPGTDFINQSVYIIIYLGPLIYSLGSLTWSNFSPNGIPKEALLPNLIALGISVVLFIIPMNTILIGCFFQDQAEKPCLFDENRLVFPSQYDRLNPTTQEEGMEDYKKYMERKKEEIKNYSKEKQAELAKKMAVNQQRGQLIQATRPMYAGFTPMQSNYNFMQPQMMTNFFPYAPQMNLRPMVMMPMAPMAPVAPMIPITNPYSPMIPQVTAVPLIPNMFAAQQPHPVSMVQQSRQALAQVQQPNSIQNVQMNYMQPNQNLARNNSNNPYGLPQYGAPINYPYGNNRPY